MATQRPPVIPPWAESGDKTAPANNAEIQTGWPLTNVPPSRQKFNWLLNFLANGILYLTRRGIADWDEDEEYLVGDKALGSDGYTYRAKVDNQGLEPQTNPTEWELWAFTATQLAGALSPLTLSSANARVGINEAAPLVKLHITGTDAIKLPVGTTGQRPAGASGYIRWNSTLQSFEGYGASGWGSLGGGAVGGGLDKIFWENDQTATTDYAITTGKNAMVAGPLAIADGITITVPDGSVLTIV
jgi:hypothetical protein